MRMAFPLISGFFRIAVSMLRVSGSLIMALITGSWTGFMRLAYLHFCFQSLPDSSGNGQAQLAQS